MPSVPVYQSPSWSDTDKSFTPLATRASLLRGCGLWIISYGQLKQQLKTFLFGINWPWRIVTLLICVLEILLLTYLHRYRRHWLQLNDTVWVLTRKFDLTENDKCMSPKTGGKTLHHLTDLPPPLQKLMEVARYASAGCSSIIRNISKTVQDTR